MANYNEESACTELSVEELVDRIKLGDSESFRLIVLKFQQRMYAYCFCMLDKPDEAEDAVQDVFLLTYSRIHQYVQQDSFSAWMYKIAYHHCLNLLRKRKSWIRFLTHYKDHTIAVAQFETYANDKSLYLRELLDKLEARDRHLVILRVLEDKSFDEISSITSIKPATLRKQFERIKKRLQHDFKEEVVSNGPAWSSSR